jgi:hypothetical protein
MGTRGPEKKIKKLLAVLLTANSFLYQPLAASFDFLTAQ